MAARIEAAFRKGDKGPAFVAYVTAGFPSPADTVPALLAMQEAGVDVIEVRPTLPSTPDSPLPFPPLTLPPSPIPLSLPSQVGVPFSDPMADGGTIQIANERALGQGVTLRTVLALVAQARAQGLTTPVVLMGYYNPLLAYGERALVEDAAKAGVDGFIVVDLPPEHAGPFLSHLDTRGLGYIPLVAPTTAEERFADIAKAARGFIYCVSVLGVTGARSELPPDLAAFAGRVRAHCGGKPFAVGFGLSTAEHVASVGKLADGVVMGSAVIRALEKGGVEGMKAFLLGVVPQKR